MPRKPPPETEPPLPLDYMLAVMGDETASPARRDEMARMAAPYLHAKAEGDGRKRRGGAKRDPAEEHDKSDADPVIRTAKTTLNRKLSRLVAARRSDPAD